MKWKVEIKRDSNTREGEKERDRQERQRQERANCENKRIRATYSYSIKVSCRAISREGISKKSAFLVKESTNFLIILAINQKISYGATLDTSAFATLPHCYELKRIILLFFLS